MIFRRWVCTVFTLKCSRPAISLAFFPSVSNWSTSISRGVSPGNSALSIPALAGDLIHQDAGDSRAEINLIFQHRGDGTAQFLEGAVF